MDVVSAAAKATWPHDANVVPEPGTSSWCQGTPPILKGLRKMHTVTFTEGYKIQSEYIYVCCRSGYPRPEFVVSM
jgi:hypothetical protein